MLYLYINRKHIIIIRRVLGLFVIILFSLMGESQTVFLGFGPNYTLTNQKKPMVGGVNYFDNTDYSFKISIEHILSKPKWSIFGDFTQYDGYTFIAFEEGTVIAPDGFPVLGDGFNGVNVYRFDIGCGYNLLGQNRKFHLKPFFGLGLQISKPNGWEIYSEAFQINGPDYFEIEPIWIDSYNTTQLVPNIGFKMGFVFWERVELALKVKGIYGFKSFQDMNFKYSYKGVPQEIAVFEATGTGVFTSLSIGYRFKKIE